MLGKNYANNPFCTKDIYAIDKVRGYYFKKNAYQRKFTRCQIIDELVSNNFQPCKSLFITLTFDAKGVRNKQNADSTINPEEVIPMSFYDEIDLYDIASNILENPSCVDPTINKKPVNNTQFQDISYCNKEFKHFIQRMNYRYRGFKYVAVMDRQDNKNWHYHMVCNLDFIPYADLHKVWGLGGAYIRSMKNRKEMTAVKKYMFKNIRSASSELEGQKGYLASRGLNRYLKSRSWVPSEKASFDHYMEALSKKEKDGLRPSDKRIKGRHQYKQKDCTEEIFVEPVIAECKCKEYTFETNLGYPSPMLEVAQRKQ